MNEALFLFLMFIGGVMLAALYLSSLWFTVKCIQYTEKPVFWLIISLALRMLLLLTAFYFILKFGHWGHLLAALAGFVMLRIVSTSRMRHQLSAWDFTKEKRT
ncbi:F1/F0 ATPase, subunit 2 [Nitrosomonas aestuarii]|uniref:F1/F0 ATPase, subunit 2 n=1 Tax=Nitrosomonas aestuarii TaxID=52441 RepID=A0A1I3ZH47_9PROT|nr:ATP synthase subunit I [Nitrosomonas aestuarii]SFK43322.1 F1/F0 ATPase, subunit 2 [Nitrosomonas aestuarii]